MERIIFRNFKVRPNQSLNQVEFNSLQTYQEPSKEPRENLKIGER